MVDAVFGFSEARQPLTRRWFIEKLVHFPCSINLKPLLGVCDIKCVKHAMAF